MTSSWRRLERRTARCSGGRSRRMARRCRRATQQLRSATQTIAVGETYDFEYRGAARAPLTLDQREDSRRASGRCRGGSWSSNGQDKLPGTINGTHFPLYLQLATCADRGSRFALPVSSCQLPASRSITDHRSPITDHRSPIPIPGEPQSRVPSRSQDRPSSSRSAPRRPSCGAAARFFDGVAPGHLEQIARARHGGSGSAGRARTDSRHSDRSDSRSRAPRQSVHPGCRSRCTPPACLAPPTCGTRYTRTSGPAL